MDKSFIYYSLHNKCNTLVKLSHTNYDKTIFFVLSCSSNYINKKEVIEKFIKPIFDNKSAEELMRLNMYEK